VGWDSSLQKAVMDSGWPLRLARGVFAGFFFFQKPPSQNNAFSCHSRSERAEVFSSIGVNVCQKGAESNRSKV